MNQVYNIRQFERIERNEQKLLKRIKILEEKIQKLENILSNSNPFNENSESNLPNVEEEGLIISNNEVTLNNEL